MTWLKNRLATSIAALAIVACGAFAYAQAAIDPVGKPADTHTGAVEHYALWHDEHGWHMRTMTKEHEHHFRGYIDAHAGTIVHEHPKDLEKHGAQADRWKIGPEKHKLTFDFSTKGGLDGIDWKVEGNHPVLEFKLEIGEKDPTFMPDRIFIGASGAHPTNDPFELPAHPGKK